MPNTIELSKMGKQSRKEDAIAVKRTNGHTKHSILADDQAVDPTLALLFASSAGPVQAPQKPRHEELPPPKRQEVYKESEQEFDDEEQESSGEEDEELSSVEEDIEDADIADLSEDDEESEEEPELENIMEVVTQKSDRKRKRNAEDDWEGKYMQKLAREEAKEEKERQAERSLKRQRVMAEQDPDMSGEEEDLDEDANKKSNDDAEKSEDEDSVEVSTKNLDIPLHESLASNKEESEIEKASRTVFLANVSTQAISSKSNKKILLAHMASFFAGIPAPTDGKPAHKVESIRFRSTAFAGTSLPKKAAFAKKELMDATTKSTNAYVVYSNAFAAREAVKKLNGTVVLDRHLRVDGVAHPSKTDHRRCVFVGNLGFVDDESLLDQGGENQRKRSKIPSDIEEGLWRQFGKAGTVESVRVVRDEKTRVGKGFAYVQFHDANAVEAALLFNEKKYPPMLPRILRVTRAKAINKTALASKASRPDFKNFKTADKSQIYNPKLSSQTSSLQGRAGRLLGRAGAAQFKKREGSGANSTAMGKRGDGKNGELGGKPIDGIARTPEKIVFEGFRASSKSKPSGLNLGGKGSGKKGKGKPKTRSSMRGSAWKKNGGRKA